MTPEELSRRIKLVAVFLHAFPDRYYVAREFEHAMRFRPRITAPPLTDAAYRMGEMRGPWGARDEMLAETNRLREIHWRGRYSMLSERDLPPSNPKPAVIEIAEVAELPRIAAGKRK